VSQTDSSSGAARAAVLAGFVFTTVYFTGLFPPVRNPNELSRLQAMMAFVGPVASLVLGGVFYLLSMLLGVRGGFIYRLVPRKHLEA